MEPPAKRLRILQSVDVDEENPEYINAKRKQKERTKSRLESIFAKYENMHESMSDDIDMRTNTVVVDRGHLRRLNRQVDRRETILLDTLGMAAGDEKDHVSDSEAGSQDSEDELAPTQPPKSKKRRLEDTVEREQSVLPPPVTPANVTGQAVVNVPNPSNPAATLLELVSFPQTPAGQQAQTTFYTTLAQTINHAVQQAVAPLFSSFLPITPSISLPLANAPPDDPIKPATDPKWYFPPLSVEKSKAQAVQPSPMRSLDSRKPANKAVTEQTKEDVQSEEDYQTEEEDTQLPNITQSAETGDQSSTTPRPKSPLVVIRRKAKGPPKKYNFTEEDDLYITEWKILHKRTWQEIKDSKDKWKNWPLQTFHKHWNPHLRDKQLHLTSVPTAFQAVPESPEPKPESNVAPPSPTQSHHLPTPSSLEQEDSWKEAEYDPEEHVAEAFPSSSHFDDDERDLLSLAGVDSDSEQYQANEDDEPFSLTQEDIILPSVEAEEFVDEDILQQGLLEDSSPIEPTFPTIATIKTEPVEAVSMINKQVTKYRVINFQVEPDLTDKDDLNLDLVASTDPSFLCTVCQKPFKTAKTLERHQNNPGQTHDKFLRKKSGSIDLVGEEDDEMQAPTTTFIKRELSTPPPTALLISTPTSRTPKPFALGAGLHSSGSKSTSKLDRRAYLKQVKQSWTKKATPGTKSVAKRRSFHTLPMKQGWDDDVDGEDELA